MKLAEIVDIETARAARGVRLVVSSIVPSPWSEAAKNLFHLAGIETKWVRTTRDEALGAWTRAHNAPVVFHDDDPPRVIWSEIVGLAARLATTKPIVPSDPAARVRTFGLLHELAGEDGLGWSGRLLMIDASMQSDGQRGFTLPVARYLAAKYGYTPERVEGARARVNGVLALFDRELSQASSGYLAGDAPGALDVYLASFLAPVMGVSVEDCPSMKPELRTAFDTIKSDPAIILPPSLAAHRARMFERHLPFPIRL